MLTSDDNEVCDEVDVRLGEWSVDVTEVKYDEDRLLAACRRPDVVCS